jgi:large subunit ribosomal protein L24
MAKIKRNDQVIVLAGKDKGKKGRVLRVITDRNRVMVEGVGMIKKHLKPDPQRNSAGGILEQEAAIHISNVALIDSDGKATRAGYRFDGDKKIRVARTNGGSLADAAS